MCDAMKNILKSLLLGMTGFVALLWTLGMASFVFFLLNDAPKAYVGEPCRSSTSWHYLPLPEQTEAGMPMAMDHSSLLDTSGFVIFRASADWQAALCTLYTHKPDHGSSGDHEIAAAMAEEAGDNRILRFIQSRQWQPFHHARLRDGEDFYFSALRDAAGEYVLVYFYSL